MSPEANLRDGDRRRLSTRQRKALVAIAARTAGNPVLRLSERTVWELVGKHATNIVRALEGRGLLENDGFGWRLTDDGRAVAELLARELEAELGAAR